MSIAEYHADGDVSGDELTLVLKIAHLSTMAPSDCGIAHFSEDLIGNLQDVTSARFQFVYARGAAEPGNNEVLVTELSSFAKLADAVSTGDFDAVDLQHEFGIWGGAEGEGIIPFLDRCRVPIVATLHTTFSQGRTSAQADLLRRLCDRAAALVVLTEASRREVVKLAPESDTKLMVARHGVPVVSWTPRTGSADEPMSFISPGYFRADKGYEIALEACADLRRRGLYFTYKIVGAAQPQFPGQMLYKNRIENLARDLGLPSVSVETRAMSRSEMLREIVSADCCVTPYTDVRQNSTGVVPWVLGCGRPVVATPFEYALCTREVVPGLFVADRVHHAALADAMAEVIEHRSPIRRSLMRKIYDACADWRWPRAAAAYREVFAKASRIHRER